MLSKNALNNMKNRYTAVLKKCRLMNTFGSLALVATLASTMAGATLATLATPSDAMAEDYPSQYAIIIPNTTINWTSTGNITKKDFVVMTDYNYLSGVYAEKGTDALTITIADGHTLTVEANGGDVFYYLEGISSFRDNATIINNGTINVTAYGEGVYTAGIYADADGDISITNNGTINVVADGDSSTTDAYAEAYGMYGYGYGDISLTNSGTIDVTAYAESTVTNANAYAYAYAYGMYAYAEADGDITLSNSGTMTVSADAYSEGYYARAEAYGMEAYAYGDITLTNSGTINVTADVYSEGYYADAYATGIYVDVNGDSSITNSGTMNVTADAYSTTDSAYAYVWGMEAYGYGDGDITLSNSGTMTVSAFADSTAGEYYTSAYAYGMFSSGAGVKYSSVSESTTDAQIMTLTNSGTMNVTADAYSTADSAEAEAYGMYAYGDITHTNSGIINVSADADSSASYARAKAYGMYAYAYGDISITNSGTITAEADAYSSASYAYAGAYGMYANASGDITLTNSGTINVTADAYSEGYYADAYGMYANASGDITLTNSGTMNVSADAYGEGDSASAYAYGMFSSGAGVKYSSVSESTTDAQIMTLTNTGVMTVSADAYSTVDSASAYAYGMYADADGVNTLSNETSGTINVTANVEGTSAYVKAYGMYVDASSAVNTLSNYGTINVTANVAELVDSDSTGSSAVLVVGMGAGGYGSTSTLNNYGTINVAVNDDNAWGTVATRAYQAYVWNNSTATIGTWNMVLGETYGTDSTDGTGYYVFGVGYSGTLTFDDNTEFVITGLIADADSDLKNGETYAISDMINQEYDDSSEVTGSVGSVSSPFDMLQVTLVNPSKDYDEQSITVKLDASAEKSPAHGAAMGAMSGATGHMNKLGGILAGVMTGGGKGGQKGDTGSAGAFNIYDTSTMTADAGETFTDAGGSYVSASSPVWDAFILPFYGYISENSGDYSTDMMGLVMGATRSVCDNFDLGFHFSIAKAESEADYTDSDATSFALGLHGMYAIDDAWYVRGQVSGFYSESDLDMVGSTSNSLTTATADMDTYGVYVELATGYDIELAPAHTITPEVALSYMYAHMEGFDSEYYMSGVASGVTFGMASEDFDALYADASVRWTGAFDFQNGALKPTAKIGIRQALTDPEVSSTLEIFGTKSTTYSDLNETAFTCEAGLSWEIGDVVTSLTYIGEFGDVEYSHVGMFKVAWEF